MARNDNGFNLDDMMEIFGDATASAKPAAAPSTAPPRAPQPPPPVAAEDLTDDEQALLRAYEKRKQDQRLQDAARRKLEELEVREREERRIIEEFEKEQASKVAAQPVAPLTDIDASENEAFCTMLDETRMVMLAFLVPLIGIKATTNMLNKSVEKARTKAPVVLKDANWQMDGTLREDGSVDPDRLLRNAANLSPPTRVDEYLAGLRELVDLRLKAVEAGLGAGPGETLRAKLRESRVLLRQKLPSPAQATWIDLFFGRVLA
ncbi:MAG TPA: hypothetical protein VK914_12960 [bacterium]|jgi:hypothetical protein|nr:hypothetical protein [bacterium]